MTNADSSSTGMNAFATTAIALAGITPSSSVAAAIDARAKVLFQTQAAESAVVRPENPGRWPHALRSALAARIANANNESALAEYFLAEAEEFAELADPSYSGELWNSGPVDADNEHTDKRQMATVIAFMDKVAVCTKEVAATDITALQTSGIADDDIVRLCELNAFLAFQLRLLAGLRLLVGEAPAGEDS